MLPSKGGTYNDGSHNSFDFSLICHGQIPKSLGNAVYVP